MDTAELSERKDPVLIDLMSASHVACTMGVGMRTEMSATAQLLILGVKRVVKVNI